MIGHQSFHAADLVASNLGGWSGEPVFAYGFEDLTGAEWALLQALAGRTEVTVSIPYEPGRSSCRRPRYVPSIGLGTRSSRTPGPRGSGSP